MKITLDQDTLRQAVISHLHNVGVTSDIVEVTFRYTRVPYTVFAEVELSEIKPPEIRYSKIFASEPTTVIIEDPIVDPDNLPPVEEPVAEEPRPDMPSAPLFDGG